MNVTRIGSFPAQRKITGRMVHQDLFEYCLQLAARIGGGTFYLMSTTGTWIDELLRDGVLQ
jgi:hypothetical protein